MNKKSLSLVFIAYLMWGVLPLYWKFLSNLDSVFILCNRIIWALVFSVILLAAIKKMPKMKELLTDKSKLKFLIPAAIIITLNWGLYIWAVNAQHVLEASLGYYMNPLVVCLFGIVIFRERVNAPQVIAIVLALVGVVFSTVQYGSFPFVALTLAISFSLYGTFKKFAHVGGIESVGVETLLITPLALLFVIFAPQSHVSMEVITVPQVLLCMGSGVVTALPLMFYSRGVNELPFVVVGFLQYIAPTLMLVIGIGQGEAFTLEQAISFGFIWVGLVVFSVGMVLQDKKAAKTEMIENMKGIKNEMSQDKNKMMQAKKTAQNEIVQDKKAVQSESMTR